MKLVNCLINDIIVIFLEQLNIDNIPNHYQCPYGLT